MATVKFTKNFAGKKKDETFTCDGQLASTLVNVDKVAVLVKEDPIEVLNSDDIQNKLTEANDLILEKDNTIKTLADENTVLKQKLDELTKEPKPEVTEATKKATKKED